MHYLACDLGAESGRLMLGSLEDNRLSLEELHRFPNVPIEDTVGRHWNVEALFAELQAGLALAGQRGLPIASISVDAWGLDYFLLDETGAVMEPTFCYRDSRNQRGIDRTLDTPVGDFVRGNRHPVHADQFALSNGCRIPRAH